LGRRPLMLGLARSVRVEAKITPAEREALTARRGNMTESDAIRAALVDWCAAGPLDSTLDNPLDSRLVALVEQAVERGFLRAMQGNPQHGNAIALADPIAQEERAAILAALANEREETLAARLGLTASQLAAIRNMRPRAPRLTDEQRAALGLQARQLALPVEEPHRTLALSLSPEVAGWVEDGFHGRAPRGMKRPRRDPTKRRRYEALRHESAAVLRAALQRDEQAAARMGLSTVEARLIAEPDMRPASPWLTDEQRAALGLQPLTDDDRAVIEWARAAE
jgi:hypothetical protein